MANETSDDLSIQIHEELNDLSLVSFNHNIFKVPEHLRNVNKEAYEPFKVAIGPYHQDKDHLKVMEKYKRRYLKILLQRRGQNDVNEYVIAMRASESRARACYETEFVNLERDDFVKMMLLDSCFIIELFRNLMDPKGYNDDPILAVPMLLNAVLRDLVLLENQLPLFVLQEFFQMTSIPNEEKYHFTDLIFVFFSCLLPNGNFKRLLTLDNEDSIKNTKHLVALLHDNLRPLSLETKKDWEFIRCATELKEAGIMFEIGGKDSLFEVKFENGVMKIPRLEISGRTETLIRNLIAYEQFFLNKDINYVTDYAKFMDCLINSSQDVELLCQCRIIHNCLGDDKVIANMFNQLGNSVTISRENFYYSNIFIKVNKHCSKPWNKWMAILRHNYFNTPWALISVLAALLLLLLTVAQTVFSAFSLNK